LQRETETDRLTCFSPRDRFSFTFALLQLQAAFTENEPFRGSTSGTVVEPAMASLSAFPGDGGNDVERQF